MDKSDNCCAICKHNQLLKVNTFCANPKQKDTMLKNNTNYSDSCSLFDLRNEDFYGSNKSETTIPPASH